MRGASSRFAMIPIAALVLITAAAMADHHEPDHETAKEMSPEEMAMMEKWQAAATPGEHHAHLAKLVGTWNAKVRFWSAPGAEPEESTGKATLTPILGGRFLQETFEGTAMGQPFSGMGVSGYDNVTGKHVSMWLDSMSTAIMRSEGTCESSCTVIKSTIETSDPMSGQRKTQRCQTTIASDKKMVFEMYDKDPSGKEFMTGEIVYTR